MIHVFRENEEQLFKVSPRNWRMSRSSRSQGEAGRATGPVGRESVLPVWAPDLLLFGPLR